jgi:uncharacterized membrane protein YgcG
VPSGNFSALISEPRLTVNVHALTMSGVSMRICKQALSIFLSVFLIVQFDGCKQKEAQVVRSQPPPTTYAAPTADQLYQLVAPIALFPDNLLAQVLAASTFPDQVTAAYQWLQQNSGLKGQQLTQAVDQQPWDASVKGLTQFSDVLQQMATNLSWTSSLGDAYFNIPQSVMNAVQVMRQRAQQAGNLKTNQQQTVQVENQAPGSAPPAEASSGQSQVTVVQPPPQTIVIQPSQPEVVYVPTYNPTAVYGAPVPAYPGYSTGAMVATGLLSFGVGIAVGAAMSGGCCGWGYNSWGCGWHNNTVVYNHNTYISNSNTFANRNNYYNRTGNYNNVNRNNINTNNINRNNINRNNVNANNLNRNNRVNNFDNNSRPNFNQNRNQTQFRNENAGNLAQQRGGTPNFNQQNRAGVNQAQSRVGNSQGNVAQQRGGSQPNFGQQNRAAGAQAQGRAENQRQAERGYGQQASRDAGNSALGNYDAGGNARTNSARGQQSLNGGGARGGGGLEGGGGRSAGGGRAAGGGRGRR